MPHPSIGPLRFRAHKLPSVPFVPVPVPPRRRWDRGWTVLAVLAVISLWLPWPVLAVLAIAAFSRWRGPDHYTKHMVPYPYRFKWDAVWILVLLALAWFGLLIWLPLADGRTPTGYVMLGFAGAFFVAFLRTVLWLSFRFPMTTWFFTIFTGTLLGFRRYGRW